MYIIYVGSRTDMCLFHFFCKYLWVPIVPRIWSMWLSNKQWYPPGKRTDTHKKKTLFRKMNTHGDIFIYYTCWITDWLVELEKVWHFHIFLVVAVCHSTCFGHGLELFATYSNTSPLTCCLNHCVWHFDRQFCSWFQNNSWSNTYLLFGLHPIWIQYVLVNLI